MDTGSLFKPAKAFNFPVRPLEKISHDLVEQIFIVNYPPTAKPMGWASGFTDSRLFLRLTPSPPVYSEVPAEIIF